MTTRKAKIVATIGPASESEEMLEKLIRAGMNVARMNFSHGTQEEHAARIARLRNVSERLGVSTGILQDLQGPKIRVGALDEPIQLEPGEEVTLYASGTIPPENNTQKIPVDFRQLFEACRNMDRLLLDDGRLRNVPVLDGRARTEIDVFSSAELERLSPALAKQARLDLVATPNAAPTTATAETRGMVIHAATPIVDAQGRLHTGDIGRFDADGDLFLVGRRSAMIKSAGERIFPEELERVLAAHPAVGEAVVVGVDDPLYGQRVVAHLAPADGRWAGEEPRIIEDVRKFCLSRVPFARAPREYVCWSAFPHKANGKPDRQAIATMKPT